jgi:hypothetical protein
VGAHRQVSSAFADCKNSNDGLHNVYDCAREGEPQIT